MAAAKAAQDNASINLGYTDVTSPITGRIGKPLVTEGALVEGTSATQMATVQQLDPIYIDFNQSTTDLAALRRAFASGKLQQVGRTPPAPRWCWRTVPSIRTRASCCSPASRLTRPPARSTCAPRCRTRRTCCCRACAREAGAGRGRQGVAGAAAGAAAHARRRPEPDAGQQGKQGRAGAGDHRRRRQDQLDRHQRPEGRRHGGGRGLPEDPPRRAGPGQPWKAGGQPGAAPAGQPAAQQPAKPAEGAPAKQEPAARPGRRPEVRLAAPTRRRVPLQ